MIILDPVGGPNVITKVCEREARGSESERGRGGDRAGGRDEGVLLLALTMEEEPRAKDCVQPLEARSKYKEMENLPQSFHGECNPTGA